MNQGVWPAALLLAAVGIAVLVTLLRGRKQSAVFSEVERLTDQIEELTLRVVGLELNLSGYRVWNAQLRGQVVELGGTPVPPPPWLSVTNPQNDGRMMADNLLVMLYHRVNDHFSESEINDLAFEVGISPDELAGETKSSRARQLVEDAYRRSKLPELTRAARRLRPGTDWPSVAAVVEYQSAISKSQ